MEQCRTHGSNRNAGSGAGPSCVGTCRAAPLIRRELTGRKRTSGDRQFERDVRIVQSVGPDQPRGMVNRRGEIARTPTAALAPKRNPGMRERVPPGRRTPSPSRVPRRFASGVGTSRPCHSVRRTCQSQNRSGRHRSCAPSQPSRPTAGQSLAGDRGPTWASPPMHRPRRPPCRRTCDPQQPCNYVYAVVDSPSNRRRAGVSQATVPYSSEQSTTRPLFGPRVVPPAP